MRVDVGKDAKRGGAARPRDARKVDQDPARVPPHKKPRRYKVTVEWTTVHVKRREMEFTTRAAADEATAKFRRWLAEREKSMGKRGPYRYRSMWDHYDPLIDYNDTSLHKVKEGPVFTVEQIDSGSDQTPGSQP